MSRLVSSRLVATMNTNQQAFVSPLASLHCWRSHTKPTSARRPSRRNSTFKACLPPESEEDRQPLQIKTSPRKHTTPPPNSDSLEEAEATFSELDELAEEWIGANLTRWEWYERMKARRQKMLGVVREREEEFNQEFEELRRTFMEVDAVFGTSMLDEQSGISPAGWGTVALIMLAYVGIGYCLFEWIVKAFTDYSPGFPL